MVRKYILTVLVCLVTAGAALAQPSVTGSVTDAETGDPLVGANVYIDDLDRGDATDAEGDFEISEVPEGTYEIRVTYTGYNEATQTVEVSSDGAEVNFELSAGVALGEVVVTAMGQEVSENTISFSSQEISDEQLNVTNDNNIRTGLAGKVSGVQMVGQAGSKLGDFGDIRIRGAISLTSDLSEPLYVVDGTPVQDPNIIDMSNVEDINVLKGPNATALYGQRGENGVVIVNTKSTDESGVSFELNNSTTFDEVAYLPDFQNKYGKGYSRGNYDPNTGSGEWVTLDADGTSPTGATYPDYLEPLNGERYIYNGYADESWGPEFDGEEYIPWYAMYPDSPYYGETAQWEAQPDNIQNFYDTGVTNKTNLAVNFNQDSYNARLSFTNLNQGGILPYSNLEKQFLNGRFNYDVTDDFNVGVNFNYTTQGIEGDVRSDEYGNQTSGTFNSWFARDLEMDKMRELKDLETPEGYHAGWNNWGPAFMGLGGVEDGYLKPAFWYNPYTWMDRYNENRDTDNVLLDVNLAYQISDRFEITGSANTTTQNYAYRFELPNSLAFSADQTGEYYNFYVNSFGVDRTEQNESNFESQVKYQDEYGDWTLDALAGTQFRNQSYDRLSSQMDRGNYQNGGLIIPDAYIFSNSAERMVPLETNWNKQVFSLFTKATFGYNDYLFIDGSFRQDWSSALPNDDNGYGYPSVGLSFVFTEVIDTDILSYGKLRAGWAQVGDDVNAEALDQTYSLNPDPYTNPKTNQGTPLLSTNSMLIDPEIVPALNSSFEAGTDLRFFEDRLGLDLTYYNEVRKDEIIGASLSRGTGYGNYLTNAGSSEREGLEVSLDGTAVQSQDFRWDVAVNWAKNTTTVTELPEGLSNYEVNAGSSFDYVSIQHRLGEEWGQLRGTGFQRDDNGERIINDSGTFAVEQDQYFGSVLPDFTGGFLNTISYKNIGLTAAIDFQKGGNFFSLTDQWGRYSGLLDVTAEDNDRDVPKRDPVDEDGGVHVTGVDEDGNEVDTYVEAQTYYKQFQDNALAEPFVHDASFVKLREVKLSYSLPSEWIDGFFNSATVEAVGRNLWLIAVHPDNENRWDPSELAETFGENGQLPGTRSYGFNVKLTF